MRLSDLVERLSGDFPCSQRKPGNESNSMSLTIVHDMVPFTIGKPVAVLNGDDGNNLTCALDMFPGNVR